MNSPTRDYSPFGNSALSYSAPSYGPVKNSSVLSGLGSVTTKAASRALTAFNPVATTVINTGLKIGAATLVTKPPTDRELFGLQPKGEPLLHSIPLVGAATKYLTGYYDATDRGRELARQQTVQGPNQILRAGDIGTALGGTQYGNAPKAGSQINQLGRETASNILIEAATAGAGGVFGGADDVNDLRKAGQLKNAPIPPTGQFKQVVESMSGRAAKYQSQISGRLPDVAYVQNGVKFDGFANGVLLEAKGPGYANFVKNGKFQGFFEGQKALIRQAEHQIRASNGAPITWHVAEPEAATAMKNLFTRENIAKIKVVHTPGAH